MKTVLEEKKVCCDCKHFIQHYIFDEQIYKLYGYRYYKICGYGHCIYPGMKSRRQKQKACDYYEERKEHKNE